MFLLLFSLFPPSQTKGIYLSPPVLQSGKLDTEIFYYAKKGYINALVIDVKNVKGNIYIRNTKYQKFIKKAKEYNIYLIARIAVFKDNALALKNNGKYALKDSAGNIWDMDGFWTDPSDTNVWEYNINIAKKALLSGFNEVQFDYVRYPSLVLGFQNDRYRENNINGFLRMAMDSLSDYGWIGIDVYGYTVWAKRLKWEGQSFKKIGKIADAVYPMLYPSHFSDGFLDSLGKEARTYQIIYRSIKTAERKLKPFVRCIPYLQAFDWKSSRLGKNYIYRQIKAADDAGSDGWILWQASGNYEQAFSEMEFYYILKGLKEVKERDGVFRYSYSPSG